MLNCTLRRFGPITPFGALFCTVVWTHLFGILALSVGYLVLGSLTSNIVGLFAPEAFGFLLRCPLHLIERLTHPFSCYHLRIHFFVIYCHSVVLLRPVVFKLAWT